LFSTPPPPPNPLPDWASESKQIREGFETSENISWKIVGFLSKMRFLSVFRETAKFALTQAQNTFRNVLIMKMVLLEILKWIAMY
jgi:hypothetical protein